MDRSAGQSNKTHDIDSEGTPNIEGATSELSTETATLELLRLARKAPFAIAPERANELAEAIMGAEEWSLLPSLTEANFWVVVPDRSIYLSHAGLASLWCVCRVAFTVMDIASRTVRNAVLEKTGQIDLGEAWIYHKLDEYVAFARRLINADEPWPTGLQVPYTTAGSDTWEGRLNNLFLASLSWIMLHEIGHAHRHHTKFVGADQRVRQEHEADAFATSWILESAGSGLKREFRTMAISTALAWLFLHEQVKGVGTDHPAAILRFREAASTFALGERSPSAENATYLFKALFDPLSSDMPEAMTPRTAFQWIQLRMEQLFSK